MGKMDFEVELKEARQELEKSNAFCFPNRILNFLAADFSDRAITEAARNFLALLNWEPGSVTRATST